MGPAVIMQVLYIFANSHLLLIREIMYLMLYILRPGTIFSHGNTCNYSLELTL